MIKKALINSLIILFFLSAIAVAEVLSKPSSLASQNQANEQLGEFEFQFISSETTLTRNKLILFKRIRGTAISQRKEPLQLEVKQDNLDGLGTHAFIEDSYTLDCHHKTIRLIRTQMYNEQHIPTVSPGRYYPPYTLSQEVFEDPFFKKVFQNYCK